MPEKKFKSSLPPKKRSKVSPNENAKTLESAVSNAIRDGTSLNPFADLVDLVIDNSNPKAIHSAIYATYRATVMIAQSGKLNGRRGVSEETELIRKWLEARVNDFTDLLAGLMKDEEKALRVCAPHDL